MAGRAIIWMPRAAKEYKEALKFYNERNGNSHYSMAIHSATRKRLATIQRFPEIGHQCDDPKLRVKNIFGFGLFYEVEDEKILIHSFWDFRRNPEDRVDRV